MPLRTTTMPRPGRTSWRLGYLRRLPRPQKRFVYPRLPRVSTATLAYEIEEYIYLIDSALPWTLAIC